MLFKYFYAAIKLRFLKTNMLHILMKKIIPWSQAHFMSNEKYHLNKAFNSTWISGELLTKFEKGFLIY